MSNIEQLKRAGLADRAVWDFGSEALPVAPAGWTGRVLADIREADEDEARSDREEQRRLLEAHTIRCRICGAPTASGHACTHGRRA